MSKSTLTVAREALLPALGAITKVVEKRNTIPILSNVLLRVDGNRMTVTGTDLDTEVSATLDCQGEQPLAITLPAGLFHDAVRKLPDGSAITIEADKTNAKVIAARSRFSIPVLPADDFPAMAADDLSHSFTIEASTLARMMASVSFAISTEETRYYLNGIFWHVVGDQLVAVATDGHRLSKFPVAAPGGADGMPGIIVPRKTVGLIKSFVGDKGDIAIDLSDRKLRLTFAGVTLLSKLVDGTFPDYQRVIPAANPNRFTVARADLARAVDRVTTISSERGSAVKFSFDTTGTLKLSAINPEAGTAEDEVALSDTQGDGVDIGFNGRYCLDLLNACTADAITFCLGGAGDPALVEPVGASEPAPLFVLMPMRV